MTRLGKPRKMRRGKSEKVLDMHLPSPDEAPLVWCPHCGQEFNTKLDDSEDHFDD